MKIKAASTSSFFFSIRISEGRNPSWEKKTFKRYLRQDGGLPKLAVVPKG